MIVAKGNSKFQSISIVLGREIEVKHLMHVLDAAFGGKPLEDDARVFVNELYAGLKKQIQ